MQTLHDRSSDLPVEIPATARSDLTPLALLSSKHWHAWPLLVLDAAEFLTRCRWCDWTSPGGSTPDAALAAFETHECQEQPA
jgi:hypothetical protein